MAIQFCRECNNIMSPKVEDGVLMYMCGRCETVAEPSSSVILSIDFRKTHNTNLQKKQEFVHDVTLPRLDAKCPKCGNRESVSYMEKSEERALNSYCVCTRCFFEWAEEGTNKVML